MTLTDPVHLSVAVVMLVGAIVLATICVSKSRTPLADDEH